MNNNVYSYFVERYDHSSIIKYLYNYHKCHNIVDFLILYRGGGGGHLRDTKKH